jgi:hypothetical protein
MAFCKEPVEITGKTQSPERFPAQKELTGHFLRSLGQI